MVELMEKRRSWCAKATDDKENVSKEVQKCFAHVINTIDNNAVGKGLHYCGLLQNGTYENLKQVLTIYRMSCVNVNIILCMDKTDFEKLCGYIKDQQQVKHLSKLYHAYQLLTESKDKSECKDNSFCLGYPLINLQFVYLTQQIQGMIKNPVLLLDDCKRLMASKTYFIPLFDKDYLKVFYTVTKPAILFQVLSIFWTWNDHSILKELLHMGKQMEALNLLDKFDQHLESFKSIPIENFPLPILSPRMIPIVTRKQVHTILAIKYRSIYYKCTWQNISELCNLLKKVFEITRKAMQLLGVLNNYSEYILMYLMIPTSVISLITSKITHPECYHMLYRNAITEVAIYPNALFSADDNLKVGPLAFFMDTSSKIIKEVPKNLKQDPENLVPYLSRTEELPEIVQILLKELSSTQTQLTRIAHEKTELSDDNKRKDTEIKASSMENADLKRAIATLKKEVKQLQDDKEDYHKKVAVDYEHVQRDLLDNVKLLEEYEAKVKALEQEKADLFNNVKLLEAKVKALEQEKADLLNNVKLLEEYEAKVKALEQEKEKTESQFKSSMESLKNQLSSLKSQIMMKTTENETLSKANASLFKHIDTLKKKEKNEKTRVEEENKMIISQFDELRNQVNILKAENSLLTEKSKTLSGQLAREKEESENEIRLLDEQNEKIKGDNSKLIAESDTLNSDKKHLEEQLEESMRQIKILKGEKLLLENSKESLSQRLIQTEQKWMKALHFSNTSARYAHSTVAVVLEQKIQLKDDKSLPRRKKSTKPRDDLDGNESSTSVASFSSTISISTTETKSTDDPEDETKLPYQVEETREDNNN